MSKSTKTPLIHRALYALKAPLLEKVKDQTVPKLMRHNAKVYADEPALFSSPTQQYNTLNAMSWHTVHLVAQQLAAYLLSQEVTQQTVLIMSRNRPEHYIADLATLYSGNTPASIYTTLTAEQIAEILKTTHCSFIIVDDITMYREVKKAIELIASQVTVLLMAPAQRAQATISWAKAIQKGTQLLTTYQDRINHTITHSKPSQPACIIFTSGTTGKPKGAILSHENVLFAAAGIQAVGTAHIPRAKLISYLPLAHVFERVVGYYGWIYSRHVIYCAWSVNDLKTVLPQVKPNIFVGVPRIYEKIEQGIRSVFVKSILSTLFEFAIENATCIRHHKQQQSVPPIWRRYLHQLFTLVLFNKIRRRIGLDHCRLCLSGSAPLDPEVIHFFGALNLDIVEGYGLTENSAPATVSWNDDLSNNMARFFGSAGIKNPHYFTCKPGRVGLPMPGTKIQLDDHGAISIYGPHVFNGYLHDQRQTNAMLHKKWLRTGDIGRIHSSGELEIIGRKKDLIVLSNGKNIAPRHIESAIARNPLVAHVCLFGDDEAYLIAVICLRYDGGEKRYARTHGIRFKSRRQLASNPAVQQLIRQHVSVINQRFSRPEQVKYFHLTSDIWSTDSGELTPTLKLKRNIIHQRYTEKIQSIYDKHDPSQHHNGHG